MTKRTIDPFFTAFAVLIAAFAVFCVTERDPRFQQTSASQISTTNHYDPDQIRLAG